MTDSIRKRKGYDIVNKRNCNNTLGQRSNRVCDVSKLQSPRVGPQSTPVVIDGHIDLKKVTERRYVSPSANSIILS